MRRAGVPSAGTAPQDVVSWARLGAVGSTELKIRGMRRRPPSSYMYRSDAALEVRICDRTILATNSTRLDAALRHAEAEREAEVADVWREAERETLPGHLADQRYMIVQEFCCELSVLSSDVF